jgi:2-polyprenyl-6-methoxyphenol hydroxylase-like FAD-dependent oxidoreductase
MQPHILISGASVAGPSLAFWLSRYGYTVTIVERAPAPRLGGYAVDFRGSGMQVLERMGLADEVRRIQTRTGSIANVNADNQIIARLPDGFTSGELEVERGRLVRILHEATRHDVDYIFGDSVTAVRQTDGSVEVDFASGRKGSYTLLVGADGLHSNVRALAFGPESQFIRYLGCYIAIYSVPDFLGLGDAGRYYVERGKRVGCFGAPNSGGATASFYFASNASDHDRRDVAGQKQLVRDTFAGVKWETQRLLAELDDAPDFYFDSLSQIRMDNYAVGRVVLLGDAASCASPLSGMGTSIAMVGAYVLAGALKEAGDNHVAAFTAYQSTMRPFVESAQMLAESVEWFIPRTRLRMWFSQRLWSWLPQSTLREIMIDAPARVASLVDLDR